METDGATIATMNKEDDEKENDPPSYRNDQNIVKKWVSRFDRME